jgi:hypothetical protein
MVRDTHLFVLSNGLELAVVVLAGLAAAAAVRNGSKFSQCNVAWGRIPQARSSVCQRFDSGWCFISI